MKDSADPLRGWPVVEVFKKVPAAKYDIYGSLFFYVQDILLKSCRQLRVIKVSIKLYHANMWELPHMDGLSQQKFDRIEV